MLWLNKLEVVKYASNTNAPHKHNHKHTHFFFQKSRIRLLDIFLSIEQFVFIQSCKRDKLLHLVNSATSVHLSYYSNKYIILSYQLWYSQCAAQSIRRPDCGS